MAVRFIEGETGAKISAELTRLKAEATTGFAPILYDVTNGVLKFYNRVTGAVQEMARLNGPAPLPTIGALALTALLHAGRTVVHNEAAGRTYTLPAATGTGNKYRIVVGVTLTSSSLVVAVASGTDYMRGVALFETDDANNVPQTFPTANTGTVATESDTITFNRTTTGLGTIGDFIEVEDIATAVFAIKVVANASGTEASPFSAAV